MIAVKKKEAYDEESIKENIERMTGIPKMFISVIKGRPFIDKAGLLYAAFKTKGINTIESECITSMYNTDNRDYSRFKAVIKTTNGETFTSYGDASKKNTHPELWGHLDHLAETRAITRALRLLTGCGFYTPEEISENETAEDTEDTEENTSEES